LGSTLAELGGGGHSRWLDDACGVHSAEKRAVPSSITDTNEARHSSGSPRLSVVRNNTCSPIPTGKRKVQFSPSGRKRTTTIAVQGDRSCSLGNRHYSGGRQSVFHSVPFIHKGMANDRRSLTLVYSHPGPHRALRHWWLRSGCMGSETAQLRPLCGARHRFVSAD
jgi:hypothetical protein